MGGSHEAGDLLKLINSKLDIVIHSNYSLPVLSLGGLKERLVILSSYSGNTEEPLDAYEEAGKLGLARAVISVGGKLLEKAKKRRCTLCPNARFWHRASFCSTSQFKKFLKIYWRRKNVGRSRKTC